MEADKKKTVVVGALVVAMLGIGAFQFAGMGAAPAPSAKTEDVKPKTKEDEEAEAKARGPKNPMYAAALPPRDPFRPAAFSASHPEPAAPVNPTVSGTGSAKIPNLPVSQPGGLVGELPTTMPSGPGPMVPPTTPSEAPAKPVFEATLIGVMVGARSAAVFRVGDSDRIVRVGGEIEPGVRLVSVTARRAVVRFHGETLRIELKDEAPADSAAPATTPARSPRGAGAASTPPTSAPTLPDSGDQIPND